MAAGPTKVRSRKIERAIRLIWSSLESHLIYSYLPSSEGKQFHKRAIKEYAEAIKILTELY